jgi:hypothetical protein
MQIDTSRGTFGDVVLKSTPEMTAIAYRLRDLIAEVYPDVTEVPRPAEQHAAYGIGLHKSTEIFGYICPMREYVRLGFYYGAALPDPKRLLVGEGKRLRHIKIHSPAEVDRPAVRQLVAAAVRERQENVGKPDRRPR